MSQNPAWYPVGETEADLFNERSWLQGAILTGVAYGAEATLFMITMRLLFLQSKGKGWLSSAPFMIYISVMFLMGTLFMAACAEMTQLSFVDQRNIPGGPAAFETVEFAIPVDELGNVCFTLANWFADALIVWRYYVIFKGSSLPTWIVMFFPGLLYLGSFVMGVMFLIQISASSPWGSESNINFTIPYFALSLSLNVITCLAITCRLFYWRWRVSRSLGAAHGTQYTSIASMIVESSALYSAFSLCFLVTFAVNNPIQNLFLQVLSQIQIIAPLLIIYRVASGKAWAQDTATRMLTDHSGSTRPSKYSSSYPASSQYRMKQMPVSNVRFDTVATDGSTFTKFSEGISVTQDVYSDGYTDGLKQVTFAGDASSVSEV